MRAIHSARRLVLLASLLAGGLVACQLIVGVKDDDGAMRPEAGAADGEGGDTRDAQPGCPLRKFPPPPTEDSDDGIGDGGDTVFFAFARIAIKPTDPDAAVIGYDLDDRCTGLPTSPGSSPTDNAASCITSDPGSQTDLDGGVDNAVQGLFELAALNSTHASSDPPANFFNDDIEAGTRTFLVALRGYKGGTNQRSVGVDLIATEGLVAADGGPAPDGGPRWDGTDVWTHTRGPYLTPQGPTVLAFKGYVKDRVLVASALGVIQLSFGGFSLPLRGASLIATIGQGTPRSLTDGTLVGRVLANDFIQASGQIPVKDIRCKLSSDPDVRALICSARDIESTASGNANATCDAISVGIGFVAVRAEVDPNAQREAEGTDCGSPLSCAP